MSETKIRALVFDWGDTVMRDSTVYHGPMVDWPEVEAMPGIEAALSALDGRFRLVLATNAAASGEARVRGALQRVGLDRFFDHVFTAKEIGVSKPAPEFFQHIQARLGLEPHEILMVGDSYRNDVGGAKRVGWRAAWYNLRRQPCPSPHPWHDADLLHLDRLPQTVEEPALPDIPTCLDWHRQQGNPDNLLRHVSAVAGVAFRLAEKLGFVGEAVDPILAHRGALLHDLDKLTSRETGQVHGEQTSQILAERGHPRLGDIARRHLIFKLAEDGDAPRTWEEKVVHYADKLVEGAQVVDLETRLRALMGRYPQYADQLKESQPHIVRLETEILDRIGQSWAEIAPELSAAAAPVEPL